MDSSNNKPNTQLKLALYGTVKVYKRGQIRVNINLLKTLGIHAGDKVDVFLDTEDRCIMIKSSETNDYRTDR